MNMFYMEGCSGARYVIFGQRGDGIESDGKTELAETKDVTTVSDSDTGWKGVESYVEDRACVDDRDCVEDVDTMVDTGCEADRATDSSLSRFPTL